ncbi:MAG: hypothetical protein ABIG95_05220 [Candidatus Woesearchaeota archaeon]
MVKIGELKKLDKSLKRSFGNVRVDILNIKDYLEKQHDSINKELAELQSQVFDVKREVHDKTKSIAEQFVRSEDFDKELSQPKRTLNQLKDDLAEVEARIERLNRSIIDQERVTSKGLEKLAESNKRDLERLKAELDGAASNYNDYVKRAKAEAQQAKVLDSKLKKLDRSIEEVEALKRELRKAVSKKDVRALEKHLGKEPLPSRVWHNLTNFFEEEPKKTERVNWWPFFFVVLLILIFLTFIYYSPFLVDKYGYLLGGGGEQPKGLVIEVKEGDLVDIAPNVTDPDGQNLSFRFSRPLDAAGRWQTSKGDAGSYPITVVVSDGETETALNFTLVVN